MNNASISDGRQSVQNQVGELLTVAERANWHVVDVFMRHDAIESFEDYWGPIERGVGSIPQVYLTLSEADRRAVREEANGRLARFEVDGTLILSLEMLIGRGQA